MKHIWITSLVAAIALVSSVQAADTHLGVQTKGQHEYMFVGADGKKAWYSALELEQIARRYADDKNLAAQVEGSEINIWVHTDGGKVLAEVWFSSGVGKPALQILIGRKGQVLKHKVVDSMEG